MINSTIVIIFGACTSVVLLALMAALQLVSQSKVISMMERGQCQPRRVLPGHPFYSTIPGTQNFCDSRPRIEEAAPSDECTTKCGGNFFARTLPFDKQKGRSFYRAMLPSQLAEGVMQDFESRSGKFCECQI